ncbi:heme NO-binding domain-containing protein [uncultured Deefgea sp.]|uniref:heme NO-binding domain-containing protein n=1 Tax=uncultured Deefgea sp. TaxID=1304914 RepID=UPI002627397C|nr:heme NO-binding domain-containing protein [uncultured Deefgea sp.]
MKGIVFNEFIEFVESAQGMVTVDAMITAANPVSGGAYTAAGYYDFQELIAMVTALSTRCNIPIPDLVRGFGKYLFGKLVAQHPDFFRDKPDVFSFLESIEGHIHVEVRRIYPDAELPRLETERRSDGSLLLRYRSRRHLADLAEGMIAGCIAYYHAKNKVSRSDLLDEGEAQVTEFIIFYE